MLPAFAAHPLPVSLVDHQIASGESMNMRKKKRQCPLLRTLTLHTPRDRSADYTPINLLPTEEISSVYEII